MLLGTGCTADQILGTAYDAGRQHSCRQAAEYKPNESMEEFKCITAQQEDRGLSWAEYRQARDQELGGREN